MNMYEPMAGAIIGRYLSSTSSTCSRSNRRHGSEFSGKRVLIGKRGEKREEKPHYDEHRLLGDLTSASRIVNAKREGENEGENVSE